VPSSGDLDGLFEEGRKGEKEKRRKGEKEKRRKGRTALFQGKYFIQGSRLVAA
jgi:hypothetical protein